jgi:hypothetical protein
MNKIEYKSNKSEDKSDSDVGREEEQFEKALGLES